MILGNIGIAYSDLGDPARAMRYYKRQLSMAKEIDDRDGTATALYNMALVEAQRGQTAKAVDYATQSLSIFEEIEGYGIDKVRSKLIEWRGQLP